MILINYYIYKLINKQYDMYRENVKWINILQKKKKEERNLSTGICELELTDKI